MGEYFVFPLKKVERKLALQLAMPVTLYFIAKRQKKYAFENVFMYPTMCKVNEALATVELIASLLIPPRGLSM